MRKRKSILKPLAVVFMLMFLGNMAIMRLFFGINVLGVMLPSAEEPAERDRLPERGESLNAGGTLEREMSPTREAQKEDEQVSSDPIAALQHLSLADKLFVLSILPKIGREGMDRLIELSDDGLASDEYEEIKMLAENCLKQSDIERLKEIFAKNQGLFAQNPGE